MEKRIRVVKEIVETGKRTDCFYPNREKVPVVGDTTHKYYFIEQAERPEINTLKERLEETKEFVEAEDKMENKCLRGFEVIPFSSEEILVLLNNKFGKHLESFYPDWKRIKHLGELIDDEFTQERKEYIKKFRDWEKTCRKSRDGKEKELLNNGTFPSFDFEAFVL